VVIAAGGVVVEDLALEPAQPRLEWAPAAVSSTAVVGTRVTETLLITNSGPLPLEVAFYEVSPTLALQVPRPADLSGAHILYDRAHGEPGTWDYDTLINDAISAGAVVAENWYYPIEASVLEGHDVLWVNCCGGTNWTSGELNAVSDWLDEGGAVLVQGESSQATDGPTGIYGTSYQSNYCTWGTTSRILEHPISTGVDAINVEWTCWQLAPGGGADTVVYDPQGQPHVVAQEQGGGKMVVIASEDFIDGHIDNDDNRLLANNILDWLALPGYGDVPWLSETPQAATIPAHSGRPVKLGLDATMLSPGEYQATLAIEHNDPAQGSPIELAVELRVIERQAGVSLTPSLQERSGVPGELVVYSFILTNAGNYTDSFRLELSGAWPATLSADTTGPLGVGESLELTLSVAIPGSAEEGSSDTTTITARSECDNEVWDSAEAITTAALWKLYLPLLLRNSD
jgi:hypothetical protein